jgi:hypothetical protein
MLRFREKLLVTAPLLIAADYEDAAKLIEQSPDLVTCIVYVTSKYVPGYAHLRTTLMSKISDFMQNLPSQNANSLTDQLTNMKALIILYLFTRTTAIQQKSEPASASSFFWSIKSSCETYALLIGLHRSVDAVSATVREGLVLQRTDVCIQLYLCWLWLFSACHQYVIQGST